MRLGDPQDAVECLAAVTLLARERHPGFDGDVLSIRLTSSQLSCTC
jgi:hypothetical protein